MTMSTIAVAMASLLAMAFTFQYMANQCEFSNPPMAARCGFLSIMCGYLIVVLFVVWVALAAGWG